MMFKGKVNPRDSPKYNDGSFVFEAIQFIGIKYQSGNAIGVHPFRHLLFGHAQSPTAMGNDHQRRFVGQFGRKKRRRRKVNRGMTRVKFRQYTLYFVKAGTQFF